MNTGQLEAIPMPGDNAFDMGFLNKAYGGKIVGRLNRPVMISPSQAGKVLYSEENIVIALYPAFFTALISSTAPMTNDTIWLAVDGVPTEFNIYLSEVE